MKADQKISLTRLQTFIKFAKTQGIKTFKLGDFSCELPPKDATRQELAALNKRILQLESMCQRLALQADESMAPRINHRPFSARIEAQRSKG